MIRFALIMAAGRGLRMMPITQSIPKPLININGSTLIAKSIRQLKKSVEHIGITVGYKAPELASHALEEGASIILNTSGQGNAWWIFNTIMKYLEEPVLVLTCDNIVELDMQFLNTNYERLHRPACMVIPVYPVPGIDGDYIFGTAGQVHRLSRNTPSDVYCSGIQVLNPRLVNDLVSKTDDFSQLWESLISIRQLCYSEPYPKSWYSVDTIVQLDTFMRSLTDNIFNNH